MKQSEEWELEEKIKRLLKEAVMDPNFMVQIQRIVRTEIGRMIMEEQEKVRKDIIKKINIRYANPTYPRPNDTRGKRGENVVTDGFKEKAEQWMTNMLTWCENCGDAKIEGKPCQVCGHESE